MWNLLDLQLADALWLCANTSADAAFQLDEIGAADLKFGQNQSADFKSTSTFSPHYYNCRYCFSYSGGLQSSLCKHPDALRQDRVLTTPVLRFSDAVVRAVPCYAAGHR